ncbi:MAG: hypothetical protein D6722_27425, partial [Bacteroidetes bacterium]
MPSDYDHWKRTIDLAAYAVRAFGFEVNRQKSTRRHQVLQAPDRDEVIVVGRDAQNGQWWYFNPQDPADKGSIIDFLLHRRGGNWAVVMAELGGMEARPAPLIDPAPSAFVLPLLAPLTQRDFLHTRGLTDTTLDAPAFAGRIFNETLDGPQGRFTYTSFPLYGRSDMVVGLERRNHGFKAQAPHSQRGEGLWRSRWEVPPAAVLITESPLDALAFHQLRPDPGRAYLSTAGRLARGQLDLVAHWFEVLAPASFWLGADRDVAGQVMNLRIAGHLPGPGR